MPTLAYTLQCSSDMKTTSPDRLIRKYTAFTNLAALRAADYVPTIPRETRKHAAARSRAIELDQLATALEAAGVRVWRG